MNDHTWFQIVAVELAKEIIDNQVIIIKLIVSPKTFINFTYICVCSDCSQQVINYNLSANETLILKKEQQSTKDHFENDQRILQTSLYTNPTCLDFSNHDDNMKLMHGLYHI